MIFWITKWLFKWFFKWTNDFSKWLFQITWNQCPIRNQNLAPNWEPKLSTKFGTKINHLTTFEMTFQMNFQMNFQMTFQMTFSLAFWNSLRMTFKMAFQLTIQMTFQMINQVSSSLLLILNSKTFYSPQNPFSSSLTLEQLYLVNTISLLRFAWKQYQTQEVLWKNFEIVCRQ